MKEFFWFVEYTASFIEVLMCSYFCGTFIMKKEYWHEKNKAVIFSLITAALTVLFNRIQLFSYMTTIVIISLCVIIQWICYRKKYLLSLGLVMVYMAIVSAIDAMVIHFSAYILETDIGLIVEQQSFVRFISILISKSILIIIAVTLNRIIVHNRTIPPVYIILMGICSIFLIIANLVMTHSEINMSDEGISAFTMVFFLATFSVEMILFGFVIKIAEGYEQKKTNSLIELNNKMLQKSLDETEQTFTLWRQSIHDYKNHMIALAQLAEEDKLVEIKEYLKKETDLIDQKIFYIKTGNSVADAIINTKQTMAENHNIAFVVHAELPSNIAVNDIDLANILGNLIDNAIEAEYKEEDPYVEITLKCEKHFLIINIRNKCTQIPVSSDLKTSKRSEEFHGIGLKSVIKTIKKYDGEISFGPNNHEFIVNILIQNINK